MGAMQAVQFSAAPLASSVLLLVRELSCFQCICTNLKHELRAITHDQLYFGHLLLANYCTLAAAALLVETQSNMLKYCSVE